MSAAEEVIDGLIRQANLRLNNALHELDASQSVLAARQATVDACQAHLDAVLSLTVREVDE